MEQITKAKIEDGQNDFQASKINLFEEFASFLASEENNNEPPEDVQTVR